MLFIAFNLMSRITVYEPVNFTRYACPLQSHNAPRSPVALSDGQLGMSGKLSEPSNIPRAKAMAGGRRTVDRIDRQYWLRSTQTAVSRSIITPVRIERAARSETAIGESLQICSVATRSPGHLGRLIYRQHLRAEITQRSLLPSSRHNVGKLVKSIF
jgi:hypothetical protein